MGLLVLRRRCAGGLRDRAGATSEAPELGAPRVAGPEVGGPAHTGAGGQARRVRAAPAGGAIASIDAPELVPAAEAVVGEDSWVLGVVAGGQARAYSLSLLNAHEVVLDTAGGTH